MKTSQDYIHFLKEVRDYAIFMLDPEGNVISWNSGAEHTEGYTESEILGKNYSVFFTDESRANNLPKKLLEMAALNTIADFTGWNLRKDGSKFYSTDIITAIYGSDNKPSGYTMITRDLTMFENNSEKLRRSEQKFRNLINSAPDAMVIVNGNGIITLVNKQTEKLFGYSREELEGKEVEILMPMKLVNSHIKLREAFNKNPKTRYMGEGKQLTGRRKDGSEFNVEIALSPIDDEQGTEFLVAAAIRDTTARTITENRIRELNRTLEQRVHDRTEELERSLNEKNTMLQEIHHRVKNNLQTVSSLLRIQSDKIEGSPAVEYLKASEHRIRSMALIHMKLYQTKDFSRINFNEYTNELCRSLLGAYGINNDRIELRTEIENVFFAIDTAMPLGLIINEMFTNSVKHAFPEGSKGIILIKMFKDKNKVNHLVFSDNGIGAGENFMNDNPAKLGILLINTLVEQLEGSITSNTDYGTEIRIEFKDLQQKTHYRT